MALARYVLTADVTLTPGAFTPDDIQGTPGTVTGTGAPANFGTGSYAQGAGLYGSGGPVKLFRNQVIWADSAGKLYTAIGAGNLRAFVDGQDTVGHYGISN